MSAETLKALGMKDLSLFREQATSQETGQTLTVV